LGETRQPSGRTERPTNRLDLHLWRYLPPALFQRLRRRNLARLRPREGKGAGLVLPWCNTEAMNLHLAEISATISPGRHAALLLDQAGWHLSSKLVVPSNISLVPLPPKCPELNPVENIWQFLRDNWLSNRIFTSYDNIVDHCCDAWSKLMDQPWHIVTIGLRDWI
jgi:hypothetical protein